MSTRTPLASEIVLAELLWYGGEQKSRKAIAEELTAEGYTQRMIDWYLFCLANHQPGAQRATQEETSL